MTQRRLIFFTSADPRTNTEAFARAYHFANVASTQGIDAEVRLAGPAVDLADVDNLPNTDAGDDVRKRIRESMDAKFEVTF